MNITHPLLSLDVIFPKRWRPKMLKKDKNKIHWLVHSKHIFFVLLSVHAEDKTDSTNYSVPLELKRRWQIDKKTNKQQSDSNKITLNVKWTKVTLGSEMNLVTFTWLFKFYSTILTNDLK